MPHLAINISSSVLDSLFYSELLKTEGFTLIVSDLTPKLSKFYHGMVSQRSISKQLQNQVKICLKNTLWFLI